MPSWPGITPSAPTRAGTAKGAPRCRPFYFTFSLDVPDGLGTDMIWIFEKPSYVTSVPEPSTLFLLVGGGLIGLGITGWRRRAKKL